MPSSIQLTADEARDTMWTKHSAGGGGGGVLSCYCFSGCKAALETECQNLSMVFIIILEHPYYTLKFLRQDPVRITFGVFSHSLIYRRYCIY